MTSPYGGSRDDAYHRRYTNTAEIVLECKNDPRRVIGVAFRRPSVSPLLLFRYSLFSSPRDDDNNNNVTPRTRL